MESLIRTLPSSPAVSGDRDFEQLQAEYYARSEELRLARRIIDDFRTSWSWRLTAPLRWVFDVLSRLRSIDPERSAVSQDGNMMAGKILLDFLPGVDARKVRAGLVARAAAREPFVPEAAWQPLVSIVIPHFNAGKDLPYAVDSVLASDFRDLEIVIVDDASTDDSRSVLQDQIRKDPRIRVLMSPVRQGPAGARNVAVEAARGRYILPLDADNFFEPDLISRCYSAMESLEDRFVYSHMYRFKPNGRTIRAFLPLYDYEELKEANYIDTCAMYRRADWVKAGGYKSGIDGYEDWEFWLQLGKSGITGHRLDAYGFWYQARPWSMVSHARWRHRQFYARIKSWHPELFRPASGVSGAERQLSQDVRLHHLRQRLRRKQEELKAAYVTIGRFKGSLSWRIMTPLRCVHDACRGLAERLGGSINAFEQRLFVQSGPCGVRPLSVMGRIGVWLSCFMRQHHAVRPLKSEWSPRVSIVIPNYDHGRYLRGAVLSALRQSARSVEVVVVDDASTDDSRKILETLRRRYYPRLRVVLHERNQGLAAARNSGILASRGELIVPLDADNLLDPMMVEACLREIQRSGQVFVYTDLYRFGKRTVRVEVPEYSFESLIQANYIDNCAMFRKSHWEDVGGYKPDVPGYEDWEFWINLGKNGIRGARIPKPLFYYRVRERSMLTDAIRHHQDHVQKLRQLHAEVYA